MGFDEFLLDAKLHIDTIGRDDLLIDCVDLFEENDDRNRVLVFELP